MSTDISTKVIYEGRLKNRYCLNREGSTKATYHVELEVPDFPFTPGDAVAIYPENQTKDVEALLNHLNLSGQELISHKKLDSPLDLYTFLKEKANLSRPMPALYKALDRERGDHDVLSLILSSPSAALSAQEFASCLGPLLPRFYSIASSREKYPGELHLTVATFTYPLGGRMVPGIGSQFLCFDADETTPIRFYHQPNDLFTLPENPNTPIIMIGPGTGVAPYRGFMQERGSETRNWLFFGERGAKTDYFYEEEWASYPQLKVDTAFSRDQEAKIYVQDRMWEKREELYRWIDEGAMLYICGDAKRMSRSVLKTLHMILEDQAGLPVNLAREMLRHWRKQKRLQLDVY